MRSVSTAQLWSLACGGAHFPRSSFLCNWKVFLTFTRYFTKNCFNIFPHSSFTFSRFMTHTKKNCNSLINVIFWNEWWIKKAIWNSFMTSFVYGLYFSLFLPVQHTVSVNLNLWYVVFLIRINLYVCRGKQWVTHYLFNFLFAVLYFVFVVASSKFIFLLLIWLLCFQMFEELFSLCCHMSARRKMRSERKWHKFLEELLFLLPGGHHRSMNLHTDSYSKEGHNCNQGSYTSIISKNKNVIRDKKDLQKL